jgi:tocopherol O-methyltransferase
MAKIPRGARVLDVGCGLGGSSTWLAENRGCSVVGVTLSPVQVKIARQRAEQSKVSDKVHFEIADANYLQVPQESFDAVWIIECSEHVGDKAALIETCYQALKPNGVIAICAWLDGSSTGPDKQLVAEVCDRMLCPALARSEDYQQWMKTSGARKVVFEDVTLHVAKTWDLCLQLVNRRDVQLVLGTLGEQIRRFVGSFKLMKRAYASGAMCYGMFAGFK